MKSWLRQPVVHFVFGGILLFAAHFLWGEPPENGDAEREEILVSPEVQAHFEARAGQENQNDVDRMVQLWVREEALLREARRLRLDAQDPIVDRRLVQLMRFALQSEVDAPDPTTEELEAYLSEHHSRYRTEATVSFEQVFFADDREGASGALAQLSSDEPPQGGRPFLHGDRFMRLNRTQVSARFGEEFSGALFKAEPGSWQGPSMSAYGVHLWKLVEHRAERLAPLESIRDRVLRDWRESENERRLELRIDALVNSYPQASHSSVE